VIRIVIIEHIYSNIFITNHTITNCKIRFFYKNTTTYFFVANNRGNVAI